MTRYPMPIAQPKLYVTIDYLVYDQHRHLQMARAGFRMTNAEEASAVCVCCEKEMVFEPTDVPQ